MFLSLSGPGNIFVAKPESNNTYTATMKVFSTIFAATKAIFAIPINRILLLPVAVGFFIFFVLIPTVTIPSNTIDFQLSLYSSLDYVTLPLLSLLMSVFILMNIYVFVQSRNMQKKQNTLSEGSVGGVSGTLASIFGAASCPMCVASLFGFLGAGGVGLLVQYQTWVFFVSLLLMIGSLYLTARKVTNICHSCGSKTANNEVHHD